MKLTTIFLIASMLQVSAATMAQQITLKKSDLTLKQLFKEVRKQTGYAVLWDSEKFNANEKVEVNFEQSSLQEVFNKVVSGKGYSYLIDEKTIIIENKRNYESIKSAVTIDVTGRVVDEQGRAIGGASVLLKATGKGVITQVDGSFTLKNVEEGAIIVIKYLGYDNKDVNAVRELGVIRLQVATNDLDAVQIQAYTKSSKRLSTSNITTIKSEDIEKQPVTNPLLALQGRVPGLQITQATGTPGSTLTIRIQGVGSLTGSSEPFYVVDGVPFNSTTVPMGGNIATVSATVWGKPSTIRPRSGGSPEVLTTSNLDPGGSGNPFSYLNPQDIESIEVLKDADATAIYGSRAANGAILITTKKGKVGKMTIDFDLSQGKNQIANRVNLLNKDQYLEIRRDAMRNSYTNSNRPFNSNDIDFNGVLDTSRETDWQNIILDNESGFSRANLGISGGNTNTTFRLSLGYNRQSSSNPLGEFNDQQFSGNFSSDVRSNNQKFRLQLSASYFMDNNKLPATDLTAALFYLSPVAPYPFNSDGSINKAENANGDGLFGLGASNPLLALYNKFNSKANSFASSTRLSYQILPGMDIITTLGYNVTASNQYTNTTMASMSSAQLRFNYPISADFGNSESSNYNIEPQLTYLKQFGKNKLSLLAGASFQQRESRSQTITASGQLTDAQLESLPFGTTFLTYQNSGVYKYFGAFANVNYNYGEKYLVNLTLRRDGSSRFGPENRYHVFASVGLGWVFSEESLLRDNLKFLSFGKLKASYGSTGNDGIGDYTFMDLHQVYANGNATIPYQTRGILPTGIVNEYLKWELNKKFNAGLDLGLFSDKIFFSANFAINRSSDLLQNLSLAEQVGVNFLPFNFPGTIRNTSFEFTLSSQNIKTSSFTWRTNFNLTLPKNKLVSLDQSKMFGSSGYQGAYLVGHSLNSVRVYKFLGVDPLSGQYVVEDKNGNPTSNPNQYIEPNDLQDLYKIMDLSSKYNGGIENSFTYHNFSFSFLLQFVNQTKQRYMTGTQYLPGTSLYNGPSIWVDRWRKPGDITALPKVSVSTGVLRPFDMSDEYFQDASFLRLKNVALTYNVPKKLSDRLGLKHFSVYLQSQNLLTFTGYEGLDPESGSSFVPPYRTTVIGLKASF